MYWNVEGAPVTDLFMISTVFEATIGIQTCWSVMIFWAATTSWALFVASASPRAASRSLMASGLFHWLKFCVPLDAAG